MNNKTQPVQPGSLAAIGVLARVYCSSYASSNHIIFSVAGLRKMIKAAQPLPPTDPADDLTIAYMSGFADGKKVAQPVQPAVNQAAEHWHELYLKQCQKNKDDAARLGGEVVGLELELSALAQPVQPIAQPLTAQEIADMGVEHGLVPEGFSNPDLEELVRRIEARAALAQPVPSKEIK